MTTGTSKHLSAQQVHALKLAGRAKVEAIDGRLICGYGNQFFMAGLTHQHGTAERNTLVSLQKRGLLSYDPGLTRRGEFCITREGLRLLKEVK